MSDSIVLYDRRNLLVKRREVGLKLSIPSGQPTPSRKQLKEEVARVLGVDPNQIVILKIRPEFGTNIVRVDVNVYDSPESVRIFERAYLLDRDQGIKKQKAEAKQQAAGAEQKP